MYGRGKKPSKPKRQNQSEENIIKSIRNLFKLKKLNAAVKDRIIRDIRTIFEQEYDCYKPIKILYFANNNYIENESNGDRNKNLSVKGYFNKIKPYLRDTIIDFQKFSRWKVQLTIAINFISSKDVDEERVMHSKSNNTKFMTYENSNDVVD